jgi:dienelactone hydrolase
VKVPVMLHYAENDLFFNPQTTRGWYERFAAGGARAEYVMQPAFGRDGHYMFSDAVGQKIWEPTVERFLAKHGVPFDRLDPLDPAKPILANERSPRIQEAGATPVRGSSATGR